MTKRGLILALSLSSASCTLFTLDELDAIKQGRDAGGTAQLVADRTSLDFGLAPVGQVSPPALLRLTNTGTGAVGTVTATLSGAGAAAFAAGPTTACEGLAPGASCDLSLTYTPSVPQLESATLTITGAPGGTVALALSGEGIVPGIISVTPSLVDFGAVVPPGQSATLTFTVRNTGSVATGLLETGLAGSDQLQFEVTADACAGVALAPDATCTLSARFAPGQAGPRRASLRVSGAPGGTGVATLIGNGVTAGGQLSLSPSTRTLPNVAAGSQGAPVTFRVTNNGAAATGAVALELTGSGAGDFELLGTDCGVLQPTTSCSAQVRFRPASAGGKVATLKASADPGGTATSSLAATAEAPAALEANPPVLDFGTVVSSAPAINTVTITNSGAQATGVLTPALTANDAGVFSIIGGCTTALLPQQNCQLDVRFAPTDNGPQSASLVVSGTPGGAVTVPISGVGATPGAVALTPQSFAFGQVLSGAMSTPRTFTATNTGGSTTSSLSVALSGNNATQYQLMMDQCSGQTLGPQASCDVTVVFAPTSGGSKSASLTVTEASGTAMAQLNGAGLLPPSLSVSPSSADFMGAVLGQQGMAIDFDVTNQGDVPTAAALMSTITGPGASSFAIIGDACATGALSGGTSCRVTVMFSPQASGAPGVKTATLAVSPLSGAGGTASAMLTGNANSPSALTFDSQSFGASPIGTTVTRTFTLSNDGGVPSGPVSLSVGGLHASEFTVQPPAGTDCRDAGVPGGGSCTVRVQWRPLVRGTRSAQLTAAAMPGGPANANLTGYGQQLATLSSGTATASIGVAENGVTTPAFSWNITNTGDLTSGTTTITKGGSNPSDFTATGCAGVLDAGASCTVSVTMTPSSAGPRAATIQLSATPGGSISLGVTGTGRGRLTVNKNDAGVGTVYSIPGGINCGPTCFTQSALFDQGTVALRARTVNGNSVFNGWDGGCSGSARDCSLNIDLSKTVLARFGSRNFNTMFVSDVPVPRNLGNAGMLTNYDALCNLMASDAGINNTTNNNYVALMSTTTISAASRLGTARGFTRVDGKAVADLQSELFVNDKIFNPIALDQYGVLRHVTVMAGTLRDGTSLPLNENCNNWATQSSTSGYSFGVSLGGPAAWIALNWQTCNLPAHLYCTMTNRVAALTPATTPGKRMWITNTPYLPGSMTPNAKCVAERPAGVTTNVKAMVGRMNPDGGAPSTNLVPGTTYVRPDGQLIGTYDKLISAQGLESGPWQTAAGTYVVSAIWTGHGPVNPVTDVPTVDTCANWTSTSASLGGSGGSAWATDGRWFRDYGELCNATGLRLLCVEQ